MSPYHLPIPDLIQAGTVAVTNLETEADLQAALQPYGYDADGIAEGRALLDALVATASGQVEGYGHQYAATDGLDGARAAFHADTYMVHVSLARVVFRREPAVQARLGIGTRRRRDFAGWYDQARVFYTNLLADPALVAAVTARGLPAADLQAARATLATLAESDARQENRKGLAQDGTATRDGAARAFADWLVDLRDFARAALRDTPEWLERLGFLHPSGDGA